MMAAYSGSQGPQGQYTATTTKVGKDKYFDKDLKNSFKGGTHLSNQQYSNCIRPEQGYCSIAYSSCTTTSFKMSTSTPTFVVGDACTNDYIIISGKQKVLQNIKICLTYSDGASSVGGTPTTDRYCGGDQLQASTTATETTVYTNRQPYQVFNTKFPYILRIFIHFILRLELS